MSFNGMGAARRAFIREILRAAPSGRTLASSPAVILLSSDSTSDGSKPMTSQDIEVAVSFLRAHRRYKTLIKRYNPLHDMSQEERVQATARRVGLNTPRDRKE